MLPHAALPLDLQAGLRGTWNRHIVDSAGPPPPPGLPFSLTLTLKKSDSQSHERNDSSDQRLLIHTANFETRGAKSEGCWVSREITQNEALQGRVGFAG